jgi:ribonuclease G
MNLLTSEKRIAILENNKAVEFYFRHPSSEDISGNIYTGRITKVLPGMQAAFVDIGLEKNGFLHRDQLLSYQTNSLPFEKKKKKNISEFAHEGEHLLVQVDKNSVGTKGPKLSNIIELSGQYIVYVPNGNYIAISKKMENESIRSYWRNEMQSILSEHEGVIVRTAAEKQTILEVKEELAKLRLAYEELQRMMKTIKPPALLRSVSTLSGKVLQDIGISNIDEIILDDISTYQQMKQKFSDTQISYYRERENVFSHYAIETEIERLNKKTVWLPNGAYLIFEHTEALTIIDVNTGKFTGKTNVKETVLKTNEQAAIEIARQIRLRDIGGMILIDFIDMKSEEEKNRILHLLHQHVKHDRTRTIVYGFTQLGIVEMTRKRVRENMLHQQTETCHTCGNGHVSSKEALAYKLERELMELKGHDAEGIWIEATRDILNVLNVQNGQLIQTLENKLHMQLVFSERLDSKPTYVIRHIGAIKDIKDRLNMID